MLQLLRICAILMLMESVITHLDKVLELRQDNNISVIWIVFLYVGLLLKCNHFSGCAAVWDTSPLRFANTANCKFNPSYLQLTK